MAKHEIVPIEEIVTYLNYTEKRIRAELDKLREYKLLYLTQKLDTIIGFARNGLRITISSSPCKLLNKAFLSFFEIYKLERNMIILQKPFIYLF